MKTFCQEQTRHLYCQHRATVSRVVELSVVYERTVCRATWSCLGRLCVAVVDAVELVRASRTSGFDVVLFWVLAVSFVLEIKRSLCCARNGK